MNVSCCTRKKKNIISIIFKLYDYNYLIIELILYTEGNKRSFTLINLIFRRNILK